MLRRRHIVSACICPCNPFRCWPRRKYAAEIAHNVSAKKRREIVERAREVRLTACLHLCAITCQACSYTSAISRPVMLPAALCAVSVTSSACTSACRKACCLLCMPAMTMRGPTPPCLTALVLPCSSTSTSPTRTLSCAARRTNRPGRIDLQCILLCTIGHQTCNQRTASRSCIDVEGSKQSEGGRSLEADVGVLHWMAGGVLAPALFVA